MKIKRPFTLKTDNISSKDLKGFAQFTKKVEDYSPKIAKMFVKLGKMAREFKQLLKEADKILSKCSDSKDDEKYNEALKKCNMKLNELNDFYENNIFKQMEEMRKE